MVNGYGQRVRLRRAPDLARQAGEAPAPAAPVEPKPAGKDALLSMFGAFANTVRAANLNRAVFREMIWDLSEISKVENVPVRVNNLVLGAVDRRLDFSLRWNRADDAAVPLLLIQNADGELNRVNYPIALSDFERFANYFSPCDEETLATALRGCLNKLEAVLANGVEGERRG